MKNRGLLILPLACLALVVFAAEGFGGKAWQQPQRRSIYEEEIVDGKGPPCPKSGSPGDHRRVPGKYPLPGTFYQTNCEDISPEAGSIIQHDQIGHTWYDFQQNGSIGRMISVTSGGFRHFSWMFLNGPYGGEYYRYVDANCKDPVNQFVAQVHVDGGVAKSAGYSNQTHLHDGRSVVAYHRTAGQMGDPVTYTMLGIEDSLCSGGFGRLWDLADSILNSPSREAGGWPKVEALYDPAEQRDYIHVVMTEMNTACGGPYMLGYERCYLETDDTLICESYVDGSTRTYTLAANTNYSDPGNLISHFDSSCTSTPMVAVSPVSQRVALVFLRPTCDRSCDYLSDVCFIESMSNGDEWIDGSLWPPPEFEITNYGCGYPEERRARGDVSACYDYQDSLHVVWVTVGFAEPGYYHPGVARLYHWGKKRGITRIAKAVWEGTDAGAHNVNIAKMSISAQDPVFHPGGDSVFLYTIWTQFDTTTPQDNSDVDYTNGEIYGCASFDGGATWGQPFNLTNTRTPGCAPGECLSEHWSSLARNMGDGDLHIQYICDRHPGTALSGQDEGSVWQDNPVIYLHLSAWDATLRRQVEYRIDEPASWHHPPIKIPHGGSRTLSMTILNIGGLETAYDLSTDDPSIAMSASGTLPPGDSVSITGSVSGEGFIAGNVILETDEGGGTSYYLPVHAVEAEDYYECPVDSETFATIDNGVLQVYANANGEMRISDVGTFPDTAHDVFFEGGTIVATSSGSDTVVGRFMLDDWRAGTRDKLYVEECNVDWEPDFWVLYSKGTFICPGHLQPPSHFKWFWWEVSEQIKIFKEDAPELYKHLVISYVTVSCRTSYYWERPPEWWPDQSPFTGYEDTYIGVAEDIDCPSDTFAQQDRLNLAGYDAASHIAWQRGWDYTGSHPAYNNYHCGVALADAQLPGQSIVPYGGHNVRNDEYLYPQGGWGWNDGELYQLASGSGVTTDDPDSIVDRSWVLTAQKIDAGTDRNQEHRFTVVRVVAPDGLTQLQEYVDSARAIVTRERHLGGLPAICGDVNGDLKVDVADMVSVLNYLFKGCPAPKCPWRRGDMTGNGVVDLGDAVTMHGYLFKGGGFRNCPGIDW
jgi:hypothetical protein